MDIRASIGQQQCSCPPSESKWGNDSEDRNKKRGQSDFQHIPHRGFEAHFEEKDDHAEARQGLDRLVCFHSLESVEPCKMQVPEKDAGDEFAEHGGLPGTDSEIARELRRCEDHGKRQEDWSDGILMPSGRKGNRKPGVVNSHCELRGSLRVRIAAEFSATRSPGLWQLSGGPTTRIL